MSVKNYNVSLTEENVERAKQNYKKYGGKLSTLLDQLLHSWNVEEESK